jgi:hypothetical protein
MQCCDLQRSVYHVVACHCYKFASLRCHSTSVYRVATVRLSSDVCWTSVWLSFDFHHRTSIWFSLSNFYLTFIWFSFDLHRTSIPFLFDVHPCSVQCPFSFCPMSILVPTNVRPQMSIHWYPSINVHPPTFIHHCSSSSMLRILQTVYSALYFYKILGHGTTPCPWMMRALSLS